MSLKMTLSNTTGAEIFINYQFELSGQIREMSLILNPYELCREKIFANQSEADAFTNSIQHLVEAHKIVLGNAQNDNSMEKEKEKMDKKASKSKKEINDKTKELLNEALKKNQIGVKVAEIKNEK